MIINSLAKWARSEAEARSRVITEEKGAIDNHENDKGQSGQNLYGKIRITITYKIMDYSQENSIIED